MTSPFGIHVESAEAVDGDTYMPIAIVDGRIELTTDEATDLEERLKRLFDAVLIGAWSLVAWPEPLVITAADVVAAVKEDWSTDEADAEIDAAWSGENEEFEIGGEASQRVV